MLLQNFYVRVDLNSVLTSQHDAGRASGGGTVYAVAVQEMLWGLWQSAVLQQLCL